MAPHADSVCVISTNAKIWKERMILILCMYCCFLSFTEYLKRRKILEVPPPPPPPSSSSEDKDHTAFLSSNQILQSADLRHTSFVLEKVRKVNMDSFFENVKILFLPPPHFHTVSVLVLGYSCRGEAAEACIVISVCLSVNLPICASVRLSSMTVRLAALPFFPPSIILLVDSCHMCLKQSFSSSGFCCLSPSVPELVSCSCACA